MKSVSFVLWLTVFSLLVSCQNRGTTGAGEEVVSFHDFLMKFPDIGTPFSWGKDSLEADFPDSLSLDRKQLGHYIADSLWTANAGKKAPSAHLYPIGKTDYGDVRLLLVATASTGARGAYLLAYGAADTLVSALSVASLEQKEPGQVFSFQLDKQFLIHIHERKALSGGQVILREQVYGINKDGSLELILTNTNQPASSGSYYNPIDTFPGTRRYSGDYLAGTSDLVSIRDGQDKGAFRFYIHLDKSGGDCTGELEGIAHFTGASTAEFKEESGPCAVHFSFSSGKVVITEAGGCGAYRGVSCYFNGTYRKKSTQKESTAKTPKSKIKKG